MKSSKPKITLSDDDLDGINRNLKRSDWINSSLVTQQRVASSTPSSCAPEVMTTALKSPADRKCIGDEKGWASHYGFQSLENTAGEN